MKLIYYIFLLLNVFFYNPFSSFSQINFTFKYSTSEDEVPFDVLQTSDGYIVCAKKGTYYPFHYDAMFLKLNEFGDTMYSKTIATPNNSTVF